MRKNGVCGSCSQEQNACVKIPDGVWWRCGFAGITKAHCGKMMSGGTGGMLKVAET